MNDLYSEMANITKVRDGLFLGDLFAGTTIDIVYEFKISHMINTASNQIPSQFASIGVKYLNLNWPENPSVNNALIKDETVTKITNFIDGCLRNGDGLMIYSVKGHNRCCVVIILYLMKKYFWSLEKSKQYMLSKKQDMKITKNFLEQLLNYEAHLNKLYPNRKRSTNWSTNNIKDPEELLMINTYINEVELAKKKNLFLENKTKNHDRRVGWADDKKFQNLGQKFLTYDIENDLYFKKNVKPITSHLNNKPLKCIIINNNIKVDNELKTDSSMEEKYGDEKFEFFDTKNLLQENKNEEEDKKEEANKNEINNNINKDKPKEKKKENKKENIAENIIENKENKDPLLNEIRISEDLSKNNKMKLNLLKNINQKEQVNSVHSVNNANNNKERAPMNIPINDFNKLGKDKNMNINFNNINMSDLNKKYYNNFMGNENNKLIKNNNNNNGYSLQLKAANKQNKKSRSTSKSSHSTNNIIPFIDYNQNNNSNNIITNLMMNHNPNMLNNNQKLFVKFNKDNNNLQFIQNNNFININYYPQNNESKYIFIFNYFLI